MPSRNLGSIGPARQRRPKVKRNDSTGSRSQQTRPLKRTAAEKRQACVAWMGRKFNTLKGIVGRLLFTLHALICVWRVWMVSSNNLAWLLCITIGLLILEGIITLTVNKGEWKWFSPSIFLYLASCIPALWFLELDLYHRRIEAKNNPSALLASAAPVTEANVLRGLDSVGDALKGLEGIQGLSGLSDTIKNLKFNFHAAPQDWAKVLEQLIFVILVIGRWLLPKGNISRDQLSQLLIVNIGMSADILELFEVFSEESVNTNVWIIYITLILWTVSMTQFCLVVTATRAMKQRVVHDMKPRMRRRHTIRKIKRGCVGFCAWWWSTEAWAVMLTILLQDLPFLVFRLFLITYHHVFSHGNIFFTSKNLLTILIQVYRMFVICAEKRKEKSRVAAEANWSAAMGLEKSKEAELGIEAIPEGDKKSAEMNGKCQEITKETSELRDLKKISEIFCISDETKIPEKPLSNDGKVGSTKGKSVQINDIPSPIDQMATTNSANKVESPTKSHVEKKDDNPSPPASEAETQEEPKPEKKLNFPGKGTKKGSPSLFGAKSRESKAKKEEKAKTVANKDGDTKNASATASRDEERAKEQKNESASDLPEKDALKNDKEAKDEESDLNELLD